MIRLIDLLNEVTNPYSVKWINPTQEYFTQELSELLGNEMRFSKEEFFHPQNYDSIYSILSHTFKMIAEHSKGSNISSTKEIKDILINKEINELMNDWDKFRHVLMKDSKARVEALNLFKMGRMEDWNKVNKKDKTSGMSQKAVNAYRRENPGSKLKTAVTTKPSKLKPGSKAAKRRKSFCARMGGSGYDVSLSASVVGFWMKK